MRGWRGVGALVVCLLAAGSAAAAATTEIEAGKGITVSSEDGATKINLSFYGQFRFQVLSRDRWRRSNLTQTFPPFEVANFGETEPSFQVRRLRLVAQGSVWKTWLDYKLEVDFAGNDEGLRSVFIPPVFTAGGASDFPGVDITAGAQDQDGRTLKLLDWYLDVVPTPLAGARVGQFKVPFGRQELVSDNKLQMTSRGIASDFFAPGRDRGAMFQGGTDTGRVQYKAGVFNGTGLAQVQNLDRSLAYAARFTVTSKGPFLDVEDIIDQPETGVHVQGGIAWYQSTDTPFRVNPQIAETDVRNTRYEADLGVFFAKRANLLLDYYARRIEVDQGFDLPKSCYGAFILGRFSCDQNGWGVQAGVALGSKDHHELSARYNKIDDDRDLDEDERTESTLNYSFFFLRHTMQISVTASYFELGLNAEGSSAFQVKVANPTADFLDPTDFPGLTGDKNWLGTIQFQWTF